MAVFGRHDPSTGPVACQELNLVTLCGGDIVSSVDTCLRLPLQSVAMIAVASNQRSGASMQVHEIRKAFLDFFQGKGHLVMPSSSLIPAADPTLLLTSAGMVQFKSYFTGEMQPPGPRLTSAQKCFRTTDIDEVGDHKHLTFFEMLGNFSVGDYFKEGAIQFAWEFMTQKLGLDPQRLWVTVYLDDDEAYDLWRTGIGVPEERLYRYGKADNWWGPPGLEGPCGPCSEIHYDFGRDHGCAEAATPEVIAAWEKGGNQGEQPGCHPNCDRCERFVELWNLVFMQFFQDSAKKLTPLPAPNIDTGMGLERTAVVLQDVRTVYDTDIFQPIVARVEQLAGVKYGDDPDRDIAIRVVAEHARSAAFLIADGVVPTGRDERGSVLRRVTRRALYHGHKLRLESVEGGFMAPIAEAVIEEMGGVYLELVSSKKFILQVLRQEEEQFGEVYETGIHILDSIFRKVDGWRGRPDVWPGEVSTSRFWPKFEDLVDASINGLQTSGGWQSSEPLWHLLLRDEEQLFEDPILLEAGENPTVRFHLAHTYEPIRAWRADAPQNAETVTRHILEQLMAALRSAEQRALVIGDDMAFLLYDTYGFPVEVTAEIAREHGLSVDMEGFQHEMKTKSESDRAAGKKFGGDFDAQRLYGPFGQTAFLGYETTTAPSVVAGLLMSPPSALVPPQGGTPERRGISLEAASVDTAAEGDAVEVLLEKTPFYAEAGGQVGDAGVIEGPDGLITVEDTQSPLAGVIVHRGRVTRGRIAVGETVVATVDRQRRQDAARNHTATHLLHAALRQVLGTHVRQAGSLVAPDRLRFDFTHVSPLSKDELRAVERSVNEKIRENVSVRKRETTYRQAIADGALAFFGDKYGDQVRVVEVANGEVYSLEVCGGTHVNATGDVGYVHVIGESGIGAGMRRVEAVTGRAAEALAREQTDLLERVAQKLETLPRELETRVAALVEEVSRLRREAAAGERAASRREGQELLDRVQEVGGVKIVAERAHASSAEALRETGDWLRDKLGSGVVVLGALVNDRPTLVAMVTPDLVGRGLHAGNIVKAAAREVGGGGGGRPEMAQAGGRDPERLDDALRAAVEAVRSQAAGG